MPWVIYDRRANRSDSLEDILDLMLDQLLGRPVVVPNSRIFIRRHDRSVRPDRISEPQYHEKITNPRGPSATVPCSCCGMRFSANLMKSGMCHNCGSKGDGAGQNRDCREQIGTPRTLKEAYQVLGCSEQDSDEIIKKRHRELAKEFHSDRLSRQTAPAGLQDSNQRFCRAQEAYEIIMIVRKKI